VKYGQEVNVIDLSAGGVRFQTTEDLKPDSTIVLEFSGATRTFLVPSRVLRCQRLGTFNQIPQLQGACEFRRPLPLDDLVGEAVPEATIPPPVGDAATDTGWQFVVGNYRDGRTVRGYTNDFSPTTPFLHICPAPSADEMNFVSLIQLDSLFFLPNPQARVLERDAIDPAPPTRGRRVAMTLPNGKEVIGTMLTYSRDGRGFFVHLPDAENGATRVFITQSGIRNIRFL
jgi:hypothetical protein